MSSTEKDYPVWGYTDTDFLVLCDDVEVGRVVKSAQTADGRDWLWSITFILRDPDIPGRWMGRADANGRAATLDAAMRFFKSKWLEVCPDLETHRATLAHLGAMHERVQAARG